MITINGRQVHADVVLNALSTCTALQQGLDTGSVILPDGVRAAWQAGDCYTFVHETAPAVHHLRWSDDRSAYGSGVDSPGYNTVKISLPYIITVIELHKSCGQFHIPAYGQQCYFRNEALRSMKDALYYPVLHNCMYNGTGVRVCLGRMIFGGGLGFSINDAMRAGISRVMSALLHSGFNPHGTDTFDDCRNIDHRISSIAEWERSTAVDPSFILTVPWVKARLTIAKLRGAAPRQPSYTSFQLEQLWHGHIINLL